MCESTGTVYNMCLILANLSKKESDLIPSEKHILLILCLHADKDTHLCWPSFKSLICDSGYSRDTINRCMHGLRGKNKIFDTGLKKGRTKSIVQYEIVFHKEYDSQTPSNPKQSDGALKQSDSQTAKQSDGKYRKDHSFKDHRKERYTPEILQKYQEYVGMFKTKQRLGMEDKDASPLAIEEWANLNHNH